MNAGSAYTLHGAYGSLHTNADLLGSLQEWAVPGLVCMLYMYRHTLCVVTLHPCESYRGLLQWTPAELMGGCCH